jgi:hypothetical protein
VLIASDLGGLPIGIIRLTILAGLWRATKFVGVPGLRVRLKLPIGITRLLLAPLPLVGATLALLSGRSLI